MKNRYKIKEKVTLEQYVNLVDGIVAEYFDNGNFQPHIGMLNAIRLFYNYFVVESPFSEKYPDGIVNALQVEEIFSDSEFAEIFNRKMTDCGDFKFDFYNAFNDAMNIVESKKNSLWSIADALMTRLEEMSAGMNQILNSENATKLLENLAKGMKSGKITEQAVAAAMANK